MTSNSQPNTRPAASPWSISGLVSFMRGAKPIENTKSIGSTASIDSKVKRLLAVQWGHDSLQAGLLDRTSGQWELQRELSVVTPTSEPRESLGDELRQGLADNDIAVSHAVVSVPLAEVVLKRFSLPNMPESQLPDAVRLQAEARGITQQQYVIDFDAHRPDEMQVWDVCLAALPMTVLQTIESQVQSAGLILGTIGIGEMAIARSVSLKSNSAQYLAICDSQEVQLVACASGLTLATSHFAQPDNPFGFPRLLTANITRMSQALHLEDESSPRSAMPFSLTILGDGAEAVVDAYSGQSDVAAVLLQPRAGATEASSELLPVIELAHQATETGMLVNYCAPKQSVDISALRRQQQKRWAVRGGLVAALLFLLVRAYISKLDDQVRTLSASNQSQTSEPEQYENAIEQAMQLSQWIGDRTNWSLELRDVLSHLPSNERAFVRTIRAEHAVGRLPDLRIEGLAREIDDAIALNQKLLRDAPQLEIRPDEIGHQGDETYYKARFVVSASLRSDDDNVLGAQ